MIKKTIVVILIFFLTFFYTIKWLDKINLNVSKETLNTLIYNSSNLNKENKVINNLVNNIIKFNLFNPVDSLKNIYNIKDNYEVVPVTNIKNDDQLIPIVYIYNTHQTEKYNSTREMNLNYSVLDASYALKEELNKYNISSLVENGSIMDILNTNNWSYAYSYVVSRMYLEKAKKNIPTLKYFIDLHRDSVNKNISTVEINNKKYARTMFLLGLENQNYKENEIILNKLEQWMNKNYKGLSRGIYKKSGPGVNGVYNQDFSINCILIEVGGEENTFEEVNNTIEVIAKMLNEYIKGQI